MAAGLPGECAVLLSHHCRILKKSAIFWPAWWNCPESCCKDLNVVWVMHRCLALICYHCLVMSETVLWELIRDMCYAEVVLYNIIIWHSYLPLA